jgi:hypothetical protein
LIISELAAQLRAQNRYLPEYLDALALECGNHQNIARSIVMRGIRGAALMAEMMSSLRTDSPVSFNGLPVLQSRDFLSLEFGPFRSETEQLSRNLLVFDLEQARIIIRPSGTEPKAKVYVDVEGSKLPFGSDRKAVLQFGELLAANVVGECIRRIGFRLSDSANLLPDYIDLDLKSSFDKEFREELLAAASRLGRQGRNEQLAWFRESLAAYGSGSDPLEGTATAVVHLLRNLETEPEKSGVTESLKTLEQTISDVTAPVD